MNSLELSLGEFVRGWWTKSETRTPSCIVQRARISYSLSQAILSRSGIYSRFAHEDPNIWAMISPIANNHWNTDKRCNGYDCIATLHVSAFNAQVKHSCYPGNEDALGMPNVTQLFHAQLTLGTIDITAFKYDDNIIFFNISYECCKWGFVVNYLRDNRVLYTICILRCIIFM